MKEAGSESSWWQLLGGGAGWRQQGFLWLPQCWTSIWREAQCKESAESPWDRRWTQSKDTDNAAFWKCPAPPTSAAAEPRTRVLWAAQENRTDAPTVCADLATCPHHLQCTCTTLGTLLNSQNTEMEFLRNFYPNQGPRCENTSGLVNWSWVISFPLPLAWAVTPPLGA